MFTHGGCNCVFTEVLVCLPGAYSIMPNQRIFPPPTVSSCFPGHWGDMGEKLLCEEVGSVQGTFCGARSRVFRVRLEMAISQSQRVGLFG